MTQRGQLGQGLVYTKQAHGRRDGMRASQRLHPEARLLAGSVHLLVGGHRHRQLLLPRYQQHGPRATPLHREQTMQRLLVSGWRRDGAADHALVLVVGQPHQVVAALLQMDPGVGFGQAAVEIRPAQQLDAQRIPRVQQGSLRAQAQIGYEARIHQHRGLAQVLSIQGGAHRQLIGGAHGG